MKNLYSFAILLVLSCGGGEIVEDDCDGGQVRLGGCSGCSESSAGGGGSGGIVGAPATWLSRCSLA